MKAMKLSLAAIAAVGLLAGCAQGGEDTTGVGPGGPGGGGGNGGIPNAENCAVPLGGVCVLAGSEGDAGLVDDLLADDGALAPIAGNINSADLEAALETLLANDEDLAGLVENLLMEGQLQEGLTQLLMGDENGDGGLADVLADLLMGTEQGDGLQDLVGEDGVSGLLMALLVEPTEPDCQVPLGTLCLITGDGNQQGLVDVLITENGSLTQITDNVSQDDLVATLASTLESDGSLANLVQNLFTEGQLAEGLQTLLVGDGEDPSSSGLVQALEGLLDPSLVEELVGTIGGLLGAGGDGGGLGGL